MLLISRRTVSRRDRAALFRFSDGEIRKHFQTKRAIRLALYREKVRSVAGRTGQGNQRKRSRTSENGRRKHAHANRNLSAQDVCNVMRGDWRAHLE